MQHASFDKYRPASVLASLGLFAVLTACAANSDARPSAGTEGIATVGAQTMRAAADTDTVSTTASSMASSTPDTSTKARARDTSGVRRDTVTKDPPITVPSVPGRSKKDSLALVSAVKAGLKSTRWPVKTAPALSGSILPGRRIVAYYGNPLSRKMGILGELPPEQMLARLDKEVAAWQRADPSTPVQPALHLIAVVAQGSPGRDGKYRLRMTDSLIETVASWAAKKNALVFLDVQVGLSTVKEELPRLVPFLKRPNFHLGLDPEFSMKSGEKPGTKIGTMNASDVNFAIGLLSDLVMQYNLPPKVLVVHRFTRGMLTGSRNIHLDPRVHVVVNMDGWGAPWLKFDSYRAYVEADPVQFAGFKLFYHNDTKKGHPLLTPGELLLLTPKPVYIQYQ